MAKVKCLVNQFDVKAGNIYQVVENEDDIIGSTCIDILDDIGEEYVLAPGEYEVIEE